MRIRSESGAGEQAAAPDQTDLAPLRHSARLEIIRDPHLGNVARKSDQPAFGALRLAGVRLKDNV